MITSFDLENAYNSGFELGFDLGKRAAELDEQRRYAQRENRKVFVDSILHREEVRSGQGK